MKLIISETLHNTFSYKFFFRNAASEKPKRGRKRLVEAPKDPYEIELIPKKFRKITNEKRFAINANSNTTSANKIKSSTTTMRQNETEQYIHPAGWKYAHIVDFENEEEIDSKRNYKLFTYHIEHRYNTLVSDINFRLHFMVKDFIDAEEERMEEEDLHGQPTTWPPLSEAYVEQYLNLENRILDQSKEKPVSRKRMLEIPENVEKNSQECALSLNEAERLQSILNSKLTQNNDDASVSLQNDSALGESITDSVFEESITNSISERSINKEPENNVNATVEDDNISNLSLSEVITDSILEERIIEENVIREVDNAKEAVTDMEVVNENQNKTVQKDIGTADKMTENANESNFEISTNNASESQQNLLDDSINSTKDSTTISDDADVTCQENENLTLNSSVQNDSINSPKDSTILSDHTNITCQENKSLTLNSSVQNDSAANDNIINLMQSNNYSEGYFSQEFYPAEDSTFNKSDSVLKASYDDDSKINLTVTAVDKMDYGNYKYICLFSLLKLYP